MAEPTTISVVKGDNLVKIVKREYGLTNNTDIMNTVNLIKDANHISNVNVIQVGQELKLPEQLRLNSVSVFNVEDGSSQTLKGDTKNYYRANNVFGDVATKQDEYPDQKPKPSVLNNITAETKNIVENVVVNIRGLFNNLTSRDAKMADIFAKQVGTWQNGDKTVSGAYNMEKTDAYRFALEQNSDDYTLRETEFRGKKEQHAFFDQSKSDGEVTLFSKEEIDGKEYFAMRDKEDNVHYFDVSNNLSEVTFDNQ